MRVRHTWNPGVLHSANGKVDPNSAGQSYSPGCYADVRIPPMSKINNKHLLLDLFNLINKLEVDFSRIYKYQEYLKNGKKKCLGPKLF